jgi:hypothetical protein
MAVVGSHPATGPALAAKQTKAKKADASKDQELDKTELALARTGKMHEEQKAKNQRLEGDRRSSTGDVSLRLNPGVLRKRRPPFECGRCAGRAWRPIAQP